MNQTDDEKLEAIIRTLTREEVLFVLEMLKELAEIKDEGFGRIIVDVQQKEISNWWKITSHTGRGFRKKLKSIADGLLEKV